MLVISRFGFDGWIWVLIASVPDLCIQCTFNFKLSIKLEKNQRLAIDQAHEQYNGLMSDGGAVDLTENLGVLIVGWEMLLEMSRLFSLRGSGSVPCKVKVKVKIYLK